MITVTCNICSKEINEMNPALNSKKNLIASLQGYLHFEFNIAVVKFDFNCTGFDVCQSCVHVAVVNALKK